MQPTKKQQDLILKNLSSILASVRRQSLVQLNELPVSMVSNEQKIEYFTKALEDSEDDVRKLANRYLENMGAAPKRNLSSPARPQAAPATKPDTSSEQNPSLVLPPVGELPPLGELPPIDELATDSQVVSPTTVVTGITSSMPHPVRDTYVRPTGSVIIEAPPLNEFVDSSIPYIENLKSIPDRLNHIQFLMKSRPSGYLTHLTKLAVDTYEEIALTALQALLTAKDPRVPPQALAMLSLPGLSSQRRFLMLKIIMETRGPIDIEPLECVLLAEKDVIVKSGLVKVFARLAMEKGTQTLITCLSDPDPRVRANTVEVIEEQNIRSCNTEIGNLLRDPENRVKVNAAKFLVKCGHPE
ncbi:MAG: HEAT repeat domain-containing protein, partial [Candidatus Riflebacteria bacterium]|nr:HEAT repeat domain-containing protein [Candidatus Riflebacteria bacterium]